MQQDHQSNMTPKLYARAGSNCQDFNFGFSKQSTTNTNISWGTTDFNLNQTYFVVFKIWFMF